MRDTTPSGFRTIIYDNASRIVGINNYTGATQAQAIANGIAGSQTFTYDNAGRLTTFSGYTSNGVNAMGQGNAAITQTQSFAYDNNGNRTNSALNGIASTYSYQAGNNRLSGVSGGISKSNTYDATGNLTNDGAQTYTYDARGRLTGATVPANSTAPTTNYLINYQGLRVRKVSTATTTQAQATNRTFIYDDGGKMLGEYDHAGNAVQELIWLGDTPVAVTGTMPCLTSTTGAAAGNVGIPTCTEAATAYIFTDHLNTPREVARINAAAPTVNQGYTSLWKWDSLPFGETTPNENPSSTGIFRFNHRFLGQYWDKETGLHQNWHRDYDVALGRYIKSDPIGLNGGLNTYSYGLSSPVANSDRKGLSTYQCTSGLATLGGAQIGFLRHDYLCVSIPLARGAVGPPSMLCSGLGQDSGILPAIMGAVPGIATVDSFNAASCQQISNANDGFDNCIRQILEGPSPVIQQGLMGDHSRCNANPL